MFQVYVPFLILSGIVLLVLAVLKGQATGRRVLNAVFGAAFLIYGLYLLLFFQGGHYFAFYYVFILPILMIVQFFRSRSAAQAAPVRAPQPGFGQQPGYGQQPAYGQPPAPGQQPGYGQPQGPAQ